MTVNNTKYTDAEWKRNQRSIFWAALVLIWGFILLWWFLG